MPVYTHTDSVYTERRTHTYLGDVYITLTYIQIHSLLWNNHQDINKKKLNHGWAHFQVLLESFIYCTEEVLLKLKQGTYYKEIFT